MHVPEQHFRFWFLCFLFFVFRIVEKGYYSERDAADAVKQILEAVAVSMKWQLWWDSCRYLFFFTESHLKSIYLWQGIQFYKETIWYIREKMCSINLYFFCCLLKDVVPCMQCHTCVKLCSVLLLWNQIRLGACSCYSLSLPLCFLSLFLHFFFVFC